MTGHTQTVTCVKWGGDGLLYTSSQDRTVKVWRAKDVRLRPMTYLVFRLVCQIQEVISRDVMFHCYGEVLCDNGDTLIYIRICVWSMCSLDGLK